MGETRLSTGTLYTDKLFTGQRNIAGLGIYHYQSRFYSPKLGRFLSADSLVPNPFNPQDFNRFAYVRNNPVRYIDPSGHAQCQTKEDCADMGTTPMGTTPNGGNRPKPKSPTGGGGGGGGRRGNDAPDPNPNGVPAPCNPLGDLVCQLQQGGYVDSAGETWAQIYDNVSEGIGYYLEGTFHPYSPMSAGNQLCGLAQTRGLACNPNTVDGGIEIIQGIVGLISFINNSPPQLTGTPFSNSPTPSVPVASLTPIPTSTVTPQYGMCQ